MIFQQNPTKRVYWAWSAFSSSPPSLVVVLGISRSIKALTFSKDPSLISTGASACRNEERSVCFTMSLFKCSLFLFTCQKQVLLVYIPPSFWMTVALKPHVLLHAIHVREWSPNTPRCRRRDFFWHQVVCQREICLHAEYPSSCFLIFSILVHISFVCYRGTWETWWYTLFGYSLKGAHIIPLRLLVVKNSPVTQPHKLLRSFRARAIGLHASNALPWRVGQVISQKMGLSQIL